jgi:cyanate lyase
LADFTQNSRGSLKEVLKMKRTEATQKILDAKRNMGLSFTEIAKQLGADRVWTTAALLGQHPLSEEQAKQLVELLALPEEVIPVLMEIPTRGSLEQIPPTDPTIYRVYEVLQVYGPTIKALIHEDFGDGIMSAITFNLDVERVESEQGPRVQIVLNGKFLPYTWQ